MKEEYQVPIPSEKDLYWEAWVDAYASFDEEIDRKLENHMYADDEEEQLYSTPIKTMMTPFGVLPLTEQALASTHFKFWVAHTNFKLLDRYYETIENCEGVETVDILTPYRFRIAVGKLFRDRDVMANVRKDLLIAVNNNEFEK